MLLTHLSHLWAEVKRLWIEGRGGAFRAFCEGNLIRRNRLAAPIVGNATWSNKLVTQMTHSSRMPGTNDASKLRARGKRMLELATRAYCEQHSDFARLFTRLAMEVFAHAKDVEKS